jgi:hypothetical protein
VVTELLVSRRIAFLAWSWIAIQVWLGGPMSLMWALMLGQTESLFIRRRVGNVERAGVRDGFD